jgi:hypothetical protein
MASPQLATGQGRDAVAPVGATRFLPLKEFRGASLGGISPDGKRMAAALYDGIDVWDYQGGQWVHEGDTILRDESLWVVELGSWKTVFSARLPGQPFLIGFFRDADELYVIMLPFPDGRPGNQQFVIDESGGIKEERRREELYQPTRGQRLLAATGDHGKPRILRLVELPDYREVASAAMEPSRSGRFGTDQIVSSQGGAFVYGVDDLVVCRRTDDLSVLWGRRIGATRVWRTAISAHGERVAAVADAAPQRRPTVPPELRPLFIDVYDGRTGSPVARFPADERFDSLALSADGGLLAVGQRIPAGDGASVDLMVDIYEIGSARRIARELHCRVPPGRYQALKGTLAAVQFSSDGLYMVTAGYDRSKVWQVVG